MLGYKKANSEEIDQTAPERIIHIMPGQKAYLAKKQFGGTIRLGTWDCRVKKGSLLREIYKKREISERHRHRYEFNNAYRKAFEKNGIIFSGLSLDKKLVEALELNKNLHPFFVGVQFHPELKSRPLSPHPIFLAFIKAASKNKVV